MNPDDEQRPDWDDGDDATSGPESRWDMSLWMGHVSLFDVPEE